MYLGNQPSSQGQAERFIFTATGTTPTITHDSNGVPISYTPSQVSVYLNGVKQVVGTDVTATNGSTLVFAADLVVGDVVECIALSTFSAAAIDSGSIVSGAIDTAHIADNQITLAKMAGGTDGNIISYDASGDPVAIATGDNGQVLTSAGAGQPPAFEDAGGGGGGAWTLIGTSVASDSATLDQTGLDSTSYDVYGIILTDIIPATDGAEPKLRMGDSSGIDSGGTDYDYHCSNLTDSSTSYGAQVSSGADYIKLNPNVGSAATEGFSAMLFLASPATSSVGPMVYGNHFGIINSGVSQGGPIIGRRVAAIDLDRIQVLMSSGNITSGRMSVYGIAHA